MSEQNGGPAFPQMLSRLQYDEAADIHRTMIDSTGGMSLRDWFAGQAPMSDQAWRGLIDVAKQDLIAAGTAWPDVMATRLAEWAYTYADAMLKERSK